jgi:hypothetical protein
MPDIGGFGRGLLKGALSATEKAADKVKDAAESASRKLSDDEPDPAKTAEPAPEVTPDPLPAAPAESESPQDEPSLDDEPEDRADESEVRDLVDRFQHLVEKQRPPAGPASDEWSIGFGALLAGHPKLPKRVGGLIRKLDHFGGVAYSSQGMAFDGDEVPWEKVVELRTHYVLPFLVGDAVQQQVSNLPLPWFPGRKRLVDALGQALLTVGIATAKDQLERDSYDMRIPAEVVYKGAFGRKKELNASFISALMLMDPAVNESLVATARSKGVRVVGADDHLMANAEERSVQLREKIEALEAELDRFKRRFGRKGQTTRN